MSREQDKFVVRMPDGMRDQVAKAADASYTSMNTFVVQAIAEKLDRGRRQELLLDALERYEAARQVAADHQQPI